MKIRKQTTKHGIIIVTVDNENPTCELSRRLTSTMLEDGLGIFEQEEHR